MALNDLSLVNLDVSNVLRVSGDMIQADRGTVVQATSITTAVTLNRRAGTITTVSAATVAGAEDSFTVTNSMVGANDVVIACLAATSSAGLPVVVVDRIAAGSFRLTITNLDAATALNNTLAINFVVIKAGA
mgnify:CR=1 FL=1